MSSESILLSCVIPVYGAEKYLKQCLLSILSKHNNIIEVIAINDGSPDGSKEILDSLAKEYSNLIVIHQENIGGAATINKGLDLAKGKYITIMDNDDYFLPDAIDIFIQYSNQYNSDVISTQAIKKWKDKEEVVFDTKYITKLEVIKAHQKPAIMNDGMYLGKFFRRDFLNTRNIRMDPTLLYADRPFVLAALASARHILLVPEKTYIWRQREDENNLSITDQMFSLKNLEDRVRSIRIIKFELESRGYSYWLDTIDYFNIPRIFWTLKKYNFSYLIKFAKITKPYFKQVNMEKMTNLTPANKFVINTICNHTYEMFAISYMKKVYKHKVNELYNKTIDLPGKLWANFKKLVLVEWLKFRNQYAENPLKNKELSEDHDPQLIVFESNFGKSYSGNPKYIYEELLRQNRSMRAVWVYQGKEKLTGIPGHVIQVHRGTPEYFNYLARAGYWVNNIRFTVTYKPKKTTYLQTWHGTPLKRLGLDIDVSGPEVEARESFLKESANWDYLLAQNVYSKEIFQRAFAVKGNILVDGYPADDILVNTPKELISNIKTKLKIPAKRKVILYAPTWRDNARKGTTWNYSFNLKLELDKLRNELGEEYTLLLRLHHLISDNINLSAFSDFVIDVSSYNDTSEILAITDILVTDYSSIYFDYMVTKKPIIFYMYDLDSYSSNLRGFYLDVDKDLPGPIVKSQEELILSIKGIKEIERRYKKRYSKLYSLFCSQQDGNSSAKVVNTVFEKLPKL